jgi:hypothetical protein
MTTTARRTARRRELERRGLREGWERGTSGAGFRYTSHIRDAAGRTVASGTGGNNALSFDAAALVAADPSITEPPG